MLEGVTTSCSHPKPMESPGKETALAVSLLAFDRGSLPVDLQRNLEREVILLKELDPAALARDLGPTNRVVLVWLPAGALSQTLEQIVSWRARSSTPVALLGCAPEGDGNDREQGLAAGFDDFVAGAISIRELAGRMRGLARRLLIAAQKVQDRLRFGRFMIDQNQHQLWVAGKRVPVTRTELAVMTVLIEARGKSRSRNDILKAAWTERDLEVGERAVDNVILRLRRKLGDPRLIVTVRGVGFRLRDA